mmetsp:Transcript_39925/g.77619  ORF Transcript_39925/g.77619 Transcript_39925/m.77619 type:complete len:264 (-) Transcript_39925:801-1592(-)
MHATLIPYIGQNRTIARASDDHPVLAEDQLRPLAGLCHLEVAEGRRHLTYARDRLAHLQSHAHARRHGGGRPHLPDDAADRAPFDRRSAQAALLDAERPFRHVQHHPKLEHGLGLVLLGIVRGRDEQVARLHDHQLLPARGKGLGVDRGGVGGDDEAPAGGAPPADGPVVRRLRGIAGLFLLFLILVLLFVLRFFLLLLFFLFLLSFLLSPSLFRIIIVITIVLSRFSVVLFLLSRSLSGSARARQRLLALHRQPLHLLLEPV